MARGRGADVTSFVFFNGSEKLNIRVDDLMITVAADGSVGRTKGMAA